MSIKLVSPTRPSIISRAKKLKAEIEQFFLDADHWNSCDPIGAPIDPDPDGKLAAIKKNLDAIIDGAFEVKLGKI